MIFNMYNNNVRRASLILVFITVILKLLGLIRELVIANYFGVSQELDIFLISYTIPAAVISVLVYSIPSLIIPRLTLIKTQYGMNEYWKAGSYILNIGFLFTLLMSLLLLMIPGKIIYFLSPNLSPVASYNSIFLLRILLIFFLFGCIFPILKGILHADNTFLLPGIASLSINITLIFSILFFANNWGNKALAFGFSFGAVIQFFILYIYMLKKGLKVNSRLSNQYINVMQISFGIILLIEIVGQLFSIIDRYYASQIEGMISALNYSMVIFMLPVSLIGLVVGSAIFPTLSEHVAGQKWAKLKSLIIKSTLLVTFIGIPVSMILLRYATAIISFIYERGSFPSNATAITAEILIYYSYGLIAVLLHTIITKVYYSLGLIKVLFIVSVSSIIIKIWLSDILFRSMYHNGLAFATSITFIISAIVLYIYLAWYLKRY